MGGVGLLMIRLDARLDEIGPQEKYHTVEV